MTKLFHKNIFAVIIIILSILLTYIPVRADDMSPIDIAGNTASSTDAAADGGVPFDAPVINASAGIVMDIDTGDILYEKNAYERHYPASITKVMTALLAIENGNVNDYITVSSEAMSRVEEGSSSIGLVAGEELTLRDALYGMMLSSGNECALAISEYIAGSVDGFSDMMNERARIIGCKDSHFVNPNGLHSDDHYTTAYDMAMIGRAAYQYPEFRTLIGTQSYKMAETNLNESRELWQENRMMYVENGSYYYANCTGGKTGYTITAHATLISFAERDGRRLVCVVMDCDPTTESYLDSIKLYNYCFDNYRLCKPLLNYEFPEMDKESTPLLSNYHYGISHNLPYYTVDKDIEFYVRSFVEDTDLEEDIHYYDEPIDDVAGYISYSYNGTFLAQSDIVIHVPGIDEAIYHEDEEEDVNAKMYKKQNYIKTIGEIVIVVAGLLISILVVVIILVRWKQRKTDARRKKRAKEREEKAKQENSQEIL